jgi:peptidoglycan/xylan/chitin deacetylase (PgdA/CDA1 family)
LPAQNKSYCVAVDDAAVPALVNSELLTVNVDVGACASVSVTVNGVAVYATYTASTQVASFNTTGTASAVVTAINWTAGGTGAATKATLYNNYRWAYSQTFDDVRQTQYDYAKPILDGLGLKAGLSAVGSWLDSGNNYYQTWTEVLAFMADGWDVYNHTWDHPDPVTCGTFINEFGQNQTAFLSEVAGYNVSHAVFPYEVSVATCAGYPQSFIISGELDYGPAYTHVGTPLSAANTLTVARNGIYGVDGAVLPAIESNCSAAANDATPSWVIYITHSVTEGDGAAADQYSTNQNTLSTLYNYLLTNWGPSGSGTMWFAPSGQVQDYLFTRDNAVLSTCTLPSTSPTDSPTVSRTPTSSATSTPTVSRTPSPSASVTPSPSPSASKSATQSATPSPSRTTSPTDSATLSPSLTATLSQTATPSVTPSRTQTLTPSASVSRTLSATPTATPTATLGATQPPTATATKTDTGTATISATQTASPVPTSTSSPLPGGTATASPLATAPPTATEPASVTVSPSGTPSTSPTGTPSLSPSASQTATASASPSLSPSLSPSTTAGAALSASPSFTETWSATPSATRSFTALPTATQTATASPTPSPRAGGTLSASATATKSATSTQRPTASPSGGPLVIRSAVPAPNPNPGLIYLDMEGPGDGVEVSVFSQALVQVRRENIPVALSAGWNEVPLGTLLKSLPLGLYYLEVQASRAGVSSSPAVVKVYLTRF